MPLEFADFAHHYRDYGMTEAEQRDDFAVFSNLCECVARFFLRAGPSNSPGITFDSISAALSDAVESRRALRAQFNMQVGYDAAEGDAP